MGYAYAYEAGKHIGASLKVKKALVLCTAGHTVEYLEEIGIAESMKTVMLKDRLLGVGAEQAEMVILGGMASKNSEVRERNLKKAFDIGRNVKIS